jgi:hypothetical protein
MDHLGYTLRTSKSHCFICQCYSNSDSARTLEMVVHCVAHLPACFTTLAIHEGGCLIALNNVVPKLPQRTLVIYITEAASPAV